MLGDSLTFTVYGKPEGWARARVSTRGARPRIFNDPKTEAAEERVRAAAVRAVRDFDASGRPLAWKCAVSVTIWAYFPRPMRLRRKKDRGTLALYTGKPDADNIAKAVLDGLTRAGIYHDDTQVADLTVRRRYLELDDEGQEVEVPRVVVTVVRRDWADA